MNDGIGRLLNQREIARLSSLALGSRFTVEGTLAGAHRSPLKGFSVEFADYRQYVPGDDLRHLDWRVFGRNERLYVRQYEEECNLRVYLLVDSSKSMAYAHKGASKYSVAAKLAGALAAVTAHQQDSVGLTIFDSEIGHRWPPAAGLSTCGCWPTARGPPAGRETNIAMTLTLSGCAGGPLVVILSDLFGDLERIRNARRTSGGGNDVIVYHVLDPRNRVPVP